MYIMFFNLHIILKINLQKLGRKKRATGEWQLSTNNNTYFFEVRYNL